MNQLVKATIIAPGAVALSCGIAYADGTDSDFLTGSDDALVLGASGISEPSSTRVADATSLYLDPNGFTGTATALDTNEGFDDGPDVTADENTITSTVVSDYDAHDFGPGDPLTIFAYSQSGVAVSDDEQTLYNDGIPTDALRLVMVGDTAAQNTDPATGYSSGGFLDNWGDTTLGEDILNFLGWGNLIDNTTPNNLYPTEVYTIYGDEYGDYVNAASNGSTIHDAYLGLTSAEIDSALPVTDGLTTYFDIPALDLTQLLDALLAAAGAVGL